MKIGAAEHDSALNHAPRYQRLQGLWLDRIGISALVAVIGFAFSEPTCAKPVAPDFTVTVRVYNYAQTSPIVLAEAEREAGRIFGEAGLKTVWLDCMPDRSSLLPQAPCQQAMEATDIRLRILPSPVRNSLQDTVFGFAVVPALATVYYESVLALAKYDEHEFESSIVLGCAIAHEIGHLLLGSNGHSLSGVMQARWERRQIQEELRGAALFTSKQARLMRAEMQRRNGSCGSAFHGGLHLQTSGVDGAPLNGVTTLQINAMAFASVGTPGNGTFIYCNDCTIANPCAGGGTGAFAKRLNGVWVCN